jgi:hypothetical protein
MTRTHALPPGAMHTMLWLWHAFAYLPARKPWRPSLDGIPSTHARRRGHPRRPPINHASPHARTRSTSVAVACVRVVSDLLRLS